MKILTTVCQVNITIYNTNKILTKRGDAHNIFALLLLFVLKLIINPRINRIAPGIWKKGTRKIINPSMSNQLLSVFDLRISIVLTNAFHYGFE
jgi:hypothetical protein